MAVFDRFRKKPGIELTAELVRELLRDHQPDLADRPLTLGARGWDNQLWRLGDDLAVRLPWQTETADALLLKENTWLPVLAPLLPYQFPFPSASVNRLPVTPILGSSPPGSRVCPPTVLPPPAAARQPMRWQRSWPPCTGLPPTGRQQDAGEEEHWRRLRRASHGSSAQ